ncbi:MAG: T9SS type A sorting domain-containing protein [Bacteroidota bacterium]
MLKRFYVLSFVLAFASLGAVAQPLQVTEDFNVPNSCGNPPFIIDDDVNYWKYTFTSQVTSNKPLVNHSIWRYITIDFYRVNTGVNTLEQTIVLGPYLTMGGGRTWEFDSNDIDLPTGDYEVYLSVRYTNGSGVPSGNMYMTVKKNGNTQCAAQSFSGDGEVECDLNRITCFGYQSCHSISVSTNKFGSSINLNISGGVGPYNITWYVEEWKTDPLPGGGTYYYNTYSVPKRCGKWIYSVTVEDLTTGCIMRGGTVATRLCAAELPKDKVIGLGGRTANDAPQFDLFPNPVNNGVVRVSYELPDNLEQAQLVIYNLQGQTVKTLSLDTMSSEMKVRVDGLSNGIYIAAIIADGQRIANDRMVINR